MQDLRVFFSWFQIITSTYILTLSCQMEAFIFLFLIFVFFHRISLIQYKRCYFRFMQKYFLKFYQHKYKKICIYGSYFQSWKNNIIIIIIIKTKTNNKCFFCHITLISCFKSFNSSEKWSGHRLWQCSRQKPQRSSTCQVFST